MKIMDLEKQTEIVHLKQNHWIMQCPNWIKKLFVKTYCPQGLVQFEDGKLAIVGNSIGWLDKFHIKALSERAADKLAFKFLEKKYPQFKGYLQLF